MPSITTEPLYLDHPAIQFLDEGGEADVDITNYNDEMMDLIFLFDILAPGLYFNYTVVSNLRMGDSQGNQLILNPQILETVKLVETIIPIRIIRFVVFDDDLVTADTVLEEVLKGSDFDRLFDRIIPFTQIFFDALPEHYHVREKLMEFVDVFGQLFENFSGFVNDFANANNIDLNGGDRLTQIGKLVGADPNDLAGYSDQVRRKFIRYQFITNRNKGLTRSVQNTLGTLGLNFDVHRKFTKNYVDFYRESELITTLGYAGTRRFDLEFSSTQAVNNSIMINQGVLTTANKLLDKVAPLTLVFDIFYKLPILSGVTYAVQFDPLLLTYFRVTSVFPLAAYMMDEPIPDTLDIVPTLYADAASGFPPMVGVTADIGEGRVTLGPATVDLDDPLLTDLAVDVEQTSSHVIYTLIIGKAVVGQINEMRLKTATGDVIAIASFPTIYKDTSFACTIEFKIPYSP